MERSAVHDCVDALNRLRHDLGVTDIADDLLVAGQRTEVEPAYVVPGGREGRHGDPAEVAARPCDEDAHPSLVPQGRSPVTVERSASVDLTG